jgi:hypothetical protein
MEKVRAPEYRGASEINGQEVMPFTFANFDAHSGLKYGLSNKADGSMHRHLQKENREKYFRGVGIDPGKVVVPDLVHGAKVEKVDASQGGMIIADTDGLVTETKDLVLSVTLADCPPIFFYDPERPAVGIAHSGWRGTEKAIAKEAVRAMQEEFGTKSGKLLAGIGPGIRKCHFDLSIEGNALHFEKNYPGLTSKQGGRMTIDLPGIIKEQLLQCGLKPENIEDSGLCTFCENESFFSYRRDKPAEIDSMVAYIGLR